MTKLLESANALLLMCSASVYWFGCGGAIETDASSGAGPEGSAGGSAISCEDVRTQFVAAAQEPALCEFDNDCVPYRAPCLQPDIDNCAGFFYTSADAVAALDVLKSGYEVCSGRPCGSGLICGIGHSPPSCKNGVCQ